MPMEVLSALELKKQQPPCHGVHTGELDRISPNDVLELPAGNYREVAGENYAGYMFIWCIEALCM